MADVRKDLAPEAETISVGPQGLPGTAPERPNVPGFEIAEELGRGGMGVVYKARQVSLNRFVALKLVLAGPYAGADQLARFRVEAESVARLQHPGIVQIHEIGSHAGHSYLALEYVPGGTLNHHCAGRPLPPDEAARLVEALARAVQYAHQRGIIHRDLKPGNVLLTEDGQPKIADFGLAKMLNAGPGSATPGPQTQSGAILGTPAYMAPEQAGGKRGGVGPPADVYALGAILYELLTGRPPFQADSPVDVILKVTTEEPLPPRRIEPGCPRDLEAVCLKCLQKDPARRYASAQALANDLVRFRKGEPTRARPATAGARFRSWAWRRRWWLAGCGTAAGLLLVLLLSLALNALAFFSLGSAGSASVSSAGGPVASEGHGVAGPPARPVFTGQPKVTAKTGGAAAAPERVALPDDLDLVPRDAIAFVTFRPGDLWKRQDVQRLVRLLGPDPARRDLEGDLGLGVLSPRLETVQRHTVVVLQPGQFPDNSVVLVATSPPSPRQPLADLLTKQGLKSREFRGRPYFARDSGAESVYLAREGVLVLSRREEWLQEWITRLPEHDAGGPLRPALDLAAGRGHHLVIGLAPPPRHLDGKIVQLHGLFPQALTDRLGQLDLRPLAEIRRASLTADLMSRADGAATDGLQVELRLSYADAAAAQKGYEITEALRDHLAAMTSGWTTGATAGPPPVIGRELALALRAARLERFGAEESIGLKMEWDPAWPEAAATAVKEEADRVTSYNNLKELALGMHDYATAYDRLPPAAILDKNGKPLLSWRVALLPLIGQINLYQQFKLDEPWDSEHNKKLLAKMPSVYAPPLKPAGWQPNTTYYQVFTGEQTLFPPGKKMAFRDIKDGPANTLLIVEALEAVPWTKPTDLPYDPARPLPALGGIFHTGFQAVMADGHTGRFLPKDIPPAALRALITPAGGEKVTPP